MQKRKGFVAMLMVVIMSLSILPAQVIWARPVAYGDVSSVPNAFWAIWTSYQDALSSGDPASITMHGERVIDFWLDGASAEQRGNEWAADPARFGYAINHVWSVSQTVFSQYERLKDIPNAIRLFKTSLALVDAYKNLIPIIGMGSQSDMEFARIRLQNLISSYDVDPELFVELHDGSGDTVFHGSLHEPRNGVIFGEPPASSAVFTSQKSASATLIYVLYESDSMEDRVNNDLRENRSQGGYETSDYNVIQIAWNFFNEGDSLAGVLNDRTKITEAAKYLASLDVPIILRIGAEMDVWEKPADPDAFIAAFRFIAEIMRQEAPNVSIMWSVNAISAEGLTHDMFYPGDAYVDWVGVSLYTSRYFLGNHNVDDVTASIYRTGKYANPVELLRPIVENFGDRKPIMISEGGVALGNRSNSEDLTEWSLPFIRQTYAYIPMLFPQVKGMFWFNVERQGAQIWSFSASPKAKELYETITSLGHFIGKGETQAASTYKKVGTVTMPSNAMILLTYAPFFIMDQVTVEYKLNGESLARLSDIAYRYPLDLSDKADGLHELSVHIRSGETVLRVMEYQIYKNGSTATISSEAITQPPASAPAPAPAPVSSEINIVINGQQRFFEIAPQTINGRTMLPLREICESLGISVSYDSSTHTANMTIGDLTATHEIGTLFVTVNGSTTEFDTESTVIDGRTLVPVRMLAEAIGAAVDWEESTRTVLINT